jgi:uncharacterized membrane protein YkvA (DUF1232 family)
MAVKARVKSAFPGAATTLLAWGRDLKRDVVALWLAARDPRAPWHAKALAAGVAAYALSPIDLIPDFIPVLGLLDDLILVPAGIWLVVRLIPAAIMADLRLEALRRDRPRSIAGAIWIALLWLTAAALFWLAWR